MDDVGILDKAKKGNLYIQNRSKRLVIREIKPIPSYNI